MIRCTNAGARRWKFQDQLIRGSSTATFSEAAVVHHAQNPPIPTTLQDANSRAATGIIAIWDVNDLRYDISVYGGYFKSIPRRLGSSRALDAATRAFVGAYPVFSTGQPSTEALNAYGAAISELREALNQPSERCKPNTLMAMQLVQNVQCWIDKPTDPFANHTIVMAHLLPEMVAQEWTDPVDQLLLMIASTVIIVMATTSSRVPLPLESMRFLFSKCLPPRPYTNSSGAPLETASLDRLMQLPIWSRAPRQHAWEMRWFYEQALLDLAGLQDKADHIKLEDETPASFSIASRMEDLNITSAALKVYVEHRIGCSIILAVAMFLNATLRAIEDPFDEDIKMSFEGRHLLEETLRLADEMKVFLPLYASGVVMTLSCAWGVENDPEYLKRIEDMQQVYNFASIGDQWKHGGGWMRNYIAGLREESVALATLSYDEAAAGMGTRDVFAESQEDFIPSRCTIL
jgi:hypothetical protein